MGTPAVMSAKIIWDVAFYWGFVGLLYMNGRFVGLADDPGFVPHLEGLIALSNRVQRFFREWAAVESGTPSVRFVDLYSPLNFMVTLHTAMMGTSAELRRTVRRRTRRLLRQLAGQLVETVLADKSSMFDRRRRRARRCRRGSGIRCCASCDPSTGASSGNPLSRTGSTPQSRAPAELDRDAPTSTRSSMSTSDVRCTHGACQRRGTNALGDRRDRMPPPRRRRLPGQPTGTCCAAETDATRVVPESRWNAARFHDPNPAKVGKMVTRRGGFLSDIDQFDPQFFGISPREAHSLDPQQRLLLQATWEALEDGGIPADGLAGTDVGVFIGGFTLDYQLLQNQGRTSRYRFKTHSATGMMMTMLANRISYRLRLPRAEHDDRHGVLEFARRGAPGGAEHLERRVRPRARRRREHHDRTRTRRSRSRRADSSAPTGAARPSTSPPTATRAERAARSSSSSRSQQALRDGDEIYAQILGTAVSQDGHTDGITVPSEEAQEAADHGRLFGGRAFTPTEIGYVEAHGTGTPVGDPVEMRALATRSRRTGRPPTRC